MNITQLTIPQTLTGQIEVGRNITLVTADQVVEFCYATTEQLHVLKEEITVFLIVLIAINLILFAIQVYQFAKVKKWI